MDYETRKKITEELYKAEYDIIETKGREYANDKDTLANFKIIANLINQSVPLSCKCQQCGASVSYEVDALLICSVYMMKHLLAILDFTGRHESLSEESIFGRVLDLRTYTKLLLCLIEDMKGDKVQDN